MKIQKSLFILAGILLALISNESRADNFHALEGRVYSKSAGGTPVYRVEITKYYDSWLSPKKIEIVSNHTTPEAAQGALNKALEEGRADIRTRAQRAAARAMVLRSIKRPE